MARTVFERSTGDVEIVRLPIAQCEASTRVLSADQVWSPTDGPNKGKHKLGNDVDVFADLVYIEDSASGAAAWGAITGTLTDQTDLASALASKVTTVGWTSQYGMSANTSGTTAVLIQPVGTESVIKTIAQIGHGLTLGQAVRLNGGAYVAAQGNSAANAACVGFVLEVVSANQFRLLTAGHSAGAPAAMFSGLTAGTAAYISPSSAGALTNTPNAFGPILMPTSATAGYVIPMTHELTYYNGTAEVLQEAIITGGTDGSGRFAIDMSGAPYSWTNIRYAAITVIDAHGVTYETSYDALTANTGRFQIGDSTGAPVGVDIPVMAILKGA